MEMTREDLVALRDASVQNAVSLLHDAQLLYLGSRWAGAHGMATLAVEEAGKAWLCHQKLIGLPGITRQDLSSHAHKAIAARQMIATVQQASEKIFNLDEVYGEHHDYAADCDFYLRMAGFYVDLTEHGVVGGANSITEDQASSSMVVAEVAVRMAKTLPEWELPDREPGSSERLVGKPLKPPVR
ncbi:AbiV family abortive infection protein [Kibdelosporangium philippinense]|uniref:AbiV family abortive infection protein n=1 Tax=Kibdelosporangium philippinense TaxID=211113 RepID=A0ABS8ZMM9_9PSEU|nr:AbiV family abortive infection protein [Kibdelosporangium philippinense]MCE7009038.1 AbiV family abortive infection protein [Kibdelosporangium philippinense]